MAHTPCAEQAVKLSAHNDRIFLVFLVAIKIQLIIMRVLVINRKGCSWAHFHSLKFSFSKFENRIFARMRNREVDKSPA